MRAACLLLLVAALVTAAPITVVIEGNFGAPSGGTTVLDNQSYLIVYTIPDSHAPTSSFVSPDMSTNATYNVPVRLSIPGLGFSIVNNVGADYHSQEPFRLWLNLMTFTGLPVGDFMVMTPLRTLNGEPLWNGLAGALGEPELTVLNDVPVYARFFVEQNMPAGGPLPLAYYENGAAYISQTYSIPEPSPGNQFAAGLLALSLLARYSLK